MSPTQTFKRTRSGPLQRVASSGQVAAGGQRSLAATPTSTLAGNHHFAAIPTRSSSAVAQLVKGEGAIPTNVEEFFQGQYHAFKQKNWSKIAQAHEQEYGSAPSADSVGAPYIIDAKVGARLIANLTESGWTPHGGHEEAVERSKQAKKAKEVVEDEKPEFRAYKTHEDARAKLKANTALGTKYRLKGGDDTVFDTSENHQDVAVKKKGPKKK
jgi:hypothetical protein